MGTEPGAYCMLCGAPADAAPGGTAAPTVCLRCGAMRERGQRLCPVCRETIPWDSERCPLCRELVDPSRAAGGPRTSSMAVVSLALGVLGCVYCLPGLLAIVLGVMARRRIRESNGMLTGERMALWGIILGSFWPLVYLVVLWMSFSAG